MQVERKICFPKGRKLRILQVSDPQDMHFVRPAMLKMLDAAYDAVQPDLVVFTGDNVHGNHLDENRLGMKTENKALIRKRMAAALAYVLRPVDERGIPFCMIYGNHDDLNPLTKQEQADLYKEYNCFFGLNDSEPELDCDTYNVPIYDSEGEKVVYNLWMLDSAGKDDGTGKGYCYVKPETIQWYRRQSEALRRENGGAPVPSLMFQHVPVPQITELFIPCEADDPDAVQWRGDDDKPYKLDPARAAGFGAEYPCVCDTDFGELDAIREMGDVCALVFGHDHANCFEADVEGVHMIQSPGASFRSYGTAKSRGVRVFEIDENDPQHYTTYILNYYDLLGKSIRTQWDYFMSADEFDAKRAVLFGAAGVATLTAGAVCAIAHRLRKK